MNGDLETANFGKLRSSVFYFIGMRILIAKDRWPQNRWYGSFLSLSATK